MKTMPTIRTVACLFALMLALSSERGSAAESKPSAAVKVPEGATVEIKPKSPVAATTPRPAWVDRPAGLYNGSYETKVLVGPESSRAALDEATQAAVLAKVVEYQAALRAEAPGVVPSPIDDKLLDQVVSEQWEERVRNGESESLFLHTQLRFDSKLQNKWQAEAQAVLSRARSEQLIRWFLMATWLVMVSHVALRCDAAWAGRNGRVAAWVIAVVLAVAPFLG